MSFHGYIEIDWMDGWMERERDVYIYIYISIFNVIMDIDPQR
jgi:hypothetical protein